MPTPPTPGPNNQTSTHKIYEDSKTSSLAAHVNSKITEGKKVALGEPGEETAQLGAEPSSEATKPGNAEKDSNAKNSNSQPENIPQRKRRGQLLLKKMKKVNIITDCENPRNTGSPDELVSE